MLAEHRGIGVVDLSCSHPYPGPIDLATINWDSDTCGCRVAVREYRIWGQKRAAIDRRAGTVIKPWLRCTEHTRDGRVVEHPMQVTTIEAMLDSGLNRDYWVWQRKRHLRMIARTEDAIAKLERGEPIGIQPWRGMPQSMQGWEAYLERVRIGVTFADDQGIRRSPGRQLRGHLSTRCPRHGNQTSSSLRSLLWIPRCGCRITQVTVGERREDGVTHCRIESLCPAHEYRGVPAAVAELKASLLGEPRPVPGPAALAVV